MGQILTVGGGTVATMAQGATTPWRDDEEAEEYARDPKAFMLERCSLFLPSIEFYHNFIVTATYYLPAFDILPNGQKWHRAEKTHDEALWQGKVGLVIGKGPTAFVDTEYIKFRGQNVEIGDWIQYDIHDPRQFTINRQHCRLLKDVHVIARLKDPRLVY